MIHPEVVIDALKPALAAGVDNEVEALIRIRVPERPEGDGKRRPRLNLAFVIDRSGSMSGAPLREACRCTLDMLRRLNARDRASVVVYDDRPAVAVESRLVDDIAVFESGIRKIVSGGSTNLHGGWLLGRQTLMDHVAPDVVSRVLLLSDGNANAGIDDPLKILAAVEEVAAAGVATSTYGLGINFNEDLMISMARRGRGRASYGETAADLIEPYQEEFSLLDALFGRKARLRVKAAGGASVEIVNGYDRLPDGSVTLPDLAYGAESWALVRFVLPATQLVPAAASGDGTSFSCLEAEVVFENIDGKHCEIPAFWLTLPILDAVAFDALPQNTLVRRRSGELRAAMFQDAAIAAAEAGDFAMVKAVLAQAKAEAAGNPWIEAVLAELTHIAEVGDQVRLIKEMKFSRFEIRNRLASLSELGVYSTDNEMKFSNFLRRKVRRGKRQF